MARLDSAARKAIKHAEKIAESENKIKKQNRKFWNGRKIISKEEWKKKVSFPMSPDYLQYISDTFTRVPFFDHPEDEKTRQARSEWVKDHLELVTSKKDPAYGRYICESCILNPSLNITSKYLRELILNGYQEDPTKPAYPCDVCSFFECPYGKRGNALVFLGETWKILDSALDCARDATIDFNGAYRVDFDRGFAGRYNFRHGYQNIELQQILDNPPHPPVPFRDIKDLYNILTNPELLGNVLEQYARSIEEKPVYDFDHDIWKKQVLGDQIQRLREENKSIIEVFEMLKDTIKIENLHPYGKTLEEEARRKQEDLESEKKWELENPERAKELAIKSGSCTVCAKFAKIYCDNCKIWMCTEHWRQHGIQVHKIELVQVHS
ncbi:MAG: hypothetical protein HZA82_02190 [Thaumarchaeota archaeon]|nr:hypothetical protein [Nitrososphaerota archaeon]